MRSCIDVNAFKLAMAVLLIAVNIFGQSTQTDGAAKESLERARAAYLKKDFDSAKRELKRAQAASKELAEPYFLLGMIAWHEGKIGDAIKSVEEAIKYQPNYPEAHYVLGKLHFEKRGWKAAEEAANLAISQGAKFANLFVLLGDVMLMQKKNDEAVKAYEQALTLPPPQSEVTEGLRARLVAVKNTIEFRAHKGDPNYKWPQHIKDQRVPRAPFGVNGKVEIAGILDENGDFRPMAVVSSVATVGMNDQLINTVLSYKFKYVPGSKNGAPVSFWLVMTYEKGIR